MNAKIENLKKDWQDRMLEGYLRERASVYQDPDIVRRVKSFHPNRSRWDLEVAVTFSGLLLALVLVLALAPLQSRVGVILMACAGIPMLVAFARVHIQSRNPHYELPRKQFLMHQKRNLEARIRLLRHGSSWYLLPLYVAFMVFLGINGWRFGQMLLSAVGLAAANLFIYRYMVKPRIRNLLQPRLDAIERRLSEYQEIESEVE